MPEWICAVISDRFVRLFKPTLFVVLSLPLIWLGFAIAGELAVAGSALGADPGEAVVLHLGEWTLRILLATLVVSPLRRLLGWPWLARLRRMIGLWGFTYLCLHVLAYSGLLAEFEWREVFEDFVERAYITAGLLALILLMPLAITSTRAWQRRLGRNWVRLHRLIYPALALGLIHLTWLSKEGYGEVFAYGVVFAVVMLERIYHEFSARR